MAIDRVELLRNAEKLLSQGKVDQAIAEYRRAVDEQPRDWTTANVLGDLYLRAGQIDKAVEEYIRIADDLGREGFFPKAGALYKKTLKIRPHDEYVLLQAADMAAQQALFVDARAYFHTVSEQRRSRGDTAGMADVTIRLARLDPSDVEARLAGARAQIEIGDVAGAVSGLKQLAAELIEDGRFELALAVVKEARPLAPPDAEIMAMLARLLADRSDFDSAKEAAQLAIERCDAAAARGDWPEAIAVLQRNLTQSPGDVSVLSRLVEVSVDGGFHDAATSAQSALADVYLAAGSGVEGRFIAEYLVAGHPDDPAHIDRLRRALTLLGVADLEAVITAHRAVPGPAGTTIEAPAVESPDAPVMAPPTSESDLSGILNDTGPAQAPALESHPAAAPPKDLDAVFADLRDEATRRFATNDPDQELATGMAFYTAGQLELAVPRLEAASRTPKHRFTAAAMLGRLHLEKGEAWPAIEWFEHAADAPAPAPSDVHRLLYELADALESVGEIARALAICLELQAEAGDYQDVAVRVDRLARVQARG